MRGTRFNDINDITVQVQQHKYVLWKIISPLILSPSLSLNI